MGLVCEVDEPERESGDSQSSVHDVTASALLDSDWKYT